jgi:hypothetical protein
MRATASAAKSRYLETGSSVESNARLRPGGRPRWPSRPFLCSHGLGVIARAVACFSFFTASNAHAEVVIDTSRDNVLVKIVNDTVGDALEALSRRISFKYRSTLPLNKIIGGNFSGSFDEVLSRLLTGFDFVVVYNPQGIEVLVYGESNPEPTQLPSLLTARQQARRIPRPAEERPEPISLAPKHLVPRGPSPFDLGASSAP